MAGIKLAGLTWAAVLAITLVVVAASDIDVLLEIARYGRDRGTSPKGVQRCITLDATVFLNTPPYFF